MENAAAPPLNSLDFWHSPGIDIRLNPRIERDTHGLTEFLQNEVGIQSAFVLATSGTTGQAKFVILEKAAMLASAESVNAHLNLSETDRWLAALTLFHVGGLQIYARAALSGSKVTTVPDPLAWDKSGETFQKLLIENDITVAALTPVHLHDLVKNQLRGPASLRGVLIGGGAMTTDLAERALDLGWPIWATYGMTESCSQIATAVDSRAALTGWLPILRGWKCREADDRFEIRGKALFSGYAMRNNEGNWVLDRPFDNDGWYRTNDRVELSKSGHELRFLGRSDDFVKSMGELVSIKRLENTLAQFGNVIVIFPVPDERRGNRFVGFVEGKEPSDLDAINAPLAPFEKIAQLVVIEEFPRTAVGKIDRGQLRKSLPNQ